jgi:lysophospholipase L1-like esterase
MSRAAYPTRNCQTGGSFNQVISPLNAGFHITTNGDSITIDRAYLNYSFVLHGLMTAALGQSASLTQRGTNGISYNYDWSGDPAIGTMTVDAISFVDPAQRGGIPNYLVVFAGTNGIHPSLGNHSAATEYADFQSYIAARTAAGWAATRIAVCTMLPRTGVDETVRTTFNALLVSGASTYGYKVARFDLNASIGAAGQNLDTTYFYDGTHMTDAGHAIAASIISAVLIP